MASPKLPALAALCCSAQPSDPERCPLDPAFLSNGSFSSCQLSGAPARLTASVSAADTRMPTFLGCDGERTRSPGWGHPEGLHLAASSGAWLSGECQDAKHFLSFSLRRQGEMSLEADMTGAGEGTGSAGPRGKAWPCQGQGGGREGGTGSVRGQEWAGVSGRSKEGHLSSKTKTAG